VRTRPARSTNRSNAVLAAVEPVEASLRAHFVPGFERGSHVLALCRAAALRDALLACVAARVGLAHKKPLGWELTRCANISDTYTSTQENIDEDRTLAAWLSENPITRQSFDLL